MENTFKGNESEHTELKELAEVFLTEYISDNSHETNSTEEIRINMVEALDQLALAKSVEEVINLLAPFKGQLRGVVEKKHLEQSVYTKLLSYLL